MGTFQNALAVASELASQRRFSEFGKRSLGLVYERRLTLGLRRDLQVALSAPSAKIPISVRKLTAEDVPLLFPENQDSLSRRERVELATRRAHFSADIPQCYVAVDLRNGMPCYCQWLMGSDQNTRIQAFFPKSWFPVLQQDEALLENAYTLAAYRGKGIMSAAMALISERGLDIGCRSVITFVDSNNVPSLRGCRKAGFSPYIVRVERRSLFGAMALRHFSGLSPYADELASAGATLPS
ncbi:GNAT family N-acetyltransferase [Methylobacterium marchantiae]|uniref:GNAT family N-acetyltransferase n=2 Tax=Methylobacterium marchantiae TaxID=600331 RepID=A0ABW3X1J9_9HYPH|nr:hypothetical protein AIGOOFII_3179 [Methylobacterium marchantiae]